jgi:hypothetical protein
MRAFTHWRWHLDEVYVKISGEMHWPRASNAPRREAKKRAPLWAGPLKAVAAGARQDEPALRASVVGPNETRTKESAF